MNSNSQQEDVKSSPLLPDVIDPTVALNSFKEQRPQLLSLIRHSVSSLADSLYAEGIISQDALEKAQSQLLGDSEKGRALLDCVEARLEIEPSDFKKFTDILRSDPFFSKLGSSLVKRYCTLSSTSTTNPPITSFTETSQHHAYGSAVDQPQLPVGISPPHESLASMNRTHLPAGPLGEVAAPHGSTSMNRPHLSAGPLGGVTVPHGSTSTNRPHLPAGFLGTLSSISTTNPPVTSFTDTSQDHAYGSAINQPRLPVGISPPHESSASMNRPHLPAGPYGEVSAHGSTSMNRPHLPAGPYGEVAAPHGSTSMNRPHLPAGPYGEVSAHGSTSMNRSHLPNGPYGEVAAPHGSTSMNRPHLPARTLVEVTAQHGSSFMNRPQLPYHPTVTTYAQILRGMYSAQPEVPKDSWPPVSSHTFINLALIKQHGISCANKYVRSTIQGDMDDIMKDKDSIQYESVFQEFQSKSLVLIEGRPGSGKTTLVHKISQDWANGKHILKGAELVFLVSLRALSNKGKFQDILGLFYRNHRAGINAIQEHINESNGNGVCFILDGLDEYSYSCNDIIFDIIHKKYLPLSMVVVASRPVATAMLRDQAAEHVEVLGFMKEQIFEYVSKYKFQDQTQTSDGLKAYLDQHRNVLHLCYLPVHTAMVCFLYQQLREDLPSTETGIYKHFTEQTLLRKLKRNANDAGYDTIQKTMKDDPFKRICELAYNMTIHSKQVMHQDELPLSDTTGRDEPGLGLVTVDLATKLYSCKDYYTFLHLTFQEYLAAWHITQLSLGEQTEVINTYGKESSMRVVWKFYCGLTQFDEDGHNFNLIASHTRDDLLKIQCAFESQQHIICDNVLKHEDEGCFSFHNCFMTTLDFTAIGYVIKNAKTHPVKTLVFDKCNFGEDDVIALQKEAGSSLSSIKSLQVTCISKDFRFVYCLLKCLTSLEELVLANTRFEKDDVIALQKEVISSLSSIKRLRIHEDFKSIYALLICLTSLEELDLVSTKFGENDVITFQKEVGSSLSPIKRFRFTGTGEDFNSVYALLKCLTSLEKLDLVGIIPGLEKQEFHHNVKSIILAESQCEIEYLKIIQRICGNELRYIKTFCFPIAYVRNNIIEVFGMPFLIHNIIRYQHVLGLQGLKLDFKSIEIFSTDLKSSFCSKIVLTNCSIDDRGAKALAIGIKHTTKLKTLNLSINKIRDEGAIALAENLKYCGDLSMLDLSCNDISDSGAKAVAKIVKMEVDLYIWNSAITRRTETLCMEGTTSIIEGYNLIKELAKLSGILNSSECLKLRTHRSAVQALSNCLGHCSNLRRLTLEINAISSDDSKLLADGLKHCRNLISLTVEGNGISDAKFLANSLSCYNQLQSLNLGNCRLRADGIKAIAESLKHCVNLHSLDLSDNDVCVEGAKFLASSLSCCGQLQSLNLGNCKLRADGIKAIAESLKHCVNLHSLDLSDNDVCTKGAKVLANSLSCFRQLQSLNLGKNMIKVDGIKAIAESLKHCVNLHSLDLSDNDVCAKGAKVLANSLSCCSQLQSLNLGKCRLKADYVEGTKFLASSLSCYNQLQSLNLRMRVDGIEAITSVLKDCVNLHSLDLSDNDLCVEGAEFLVALFCQCSQLRSLNLARSNIGVDSAKVIVDCLKYCVNLHTLDFSNVCICAESVANVLIHCRQLRSLNLENNRLGNDGTKVIADALDGNRDLNLTTLNLSDNGISDEGINSLSYLLKCSKNLEILQLRDNYLVGPNGAKVLAACLEHLAKLQSIDLKNTRIDDIGAIALANGLKYCNNMRTVLLEYDRIGTDGAKALANVLKHCSNLEILDFGENNIGDDGVVALADGLQHCNNLQAIYFQGTGLGAIGAKVLAGSLMHCSNLRILHLHFNRIGADGAVALADGLHCWCNLQALNLGHNIVSDDGAKALACSLKNCRNLETLNLEDNNISSEGARALAYGLCYSLKRLDLGCKSNRIGAEGAVALSCGLKHCSNLQTLDLGQNNMRDSGAVALANSLRHCNNLHTLDLKGNSIGDDAKAFLTDRLKHCQHLCI